MSNSNIKVPRPLSPETLPNASEDEAFERANELIRALDLESRAQMEQISAEEKGCVPEDSAL